MSKRDDNKAPAPAEAAGGRSYIKLQHAWREHPADKVLEASADLLAALEKDGIGYAAASDFERRIGGF